jgi:large subunit ribosomal protein L24
VVVAGKYKGKRGTVLRVVNDDYLVVEGANRVKKHQKPNPMKGTTGGIIDKEMPLHVSNVAVFNPATQKGDRVGTKILQDGRKVRVFRSNGEMLDA